MQTYGMNYTVYAIIMCLFVHMPVTISVVLKWLDVQTGCEAALPSAISESNWFLEIKNENTQNNKKIP